MIRWIAVLSDGATVKEGEGDFQIIAGERKPWVRLCSYCSANKLHIKDLRLETDAGVIKLFLDTPDFYAVQYIAEGVIEDGQFTQQHLIDIGGFYGSSSVHYIYSATTQKGHWERRKNVIPLVPSPRA